MIKSFKHKGLELFFTKDNSKLLNRQQIKRIARMLDRLDAAMCVDDMDLPGYGLHPLKGKLKGYWSVKVSGNWRIMFQFEGNDAFNINLEDYH